jgi:hypothetical protein
VLSSADYSFIQADGLNSNAAVGGAYCPGATTTCPTYGSGLGWYSAQPYYHRDQALFGELYYDLADFDAYAGEGFIDPRVATLQPFHAGLEFRHHC